jgi:hypothetical protein
LIHKPATIKAQRMVEIAYRIEESCVLPEAIGSRRETLR